MIGERRLDILSFSETKIEGKGEWEVEGNIAKSGVTVLFAGKL